jgi:hypothetical protein
MLNSGKKIHALRDKKKKFELPPLQVKWLFVINQIYFFFSMNLRNVHSTQEAGKW